MKQLVHFIWLILLSQQAFSQTITWTGATDTDWATGTNWSTNVAPTNANKVNIPGSLVRYPVLNTNASIQNLVVEAGATLTVNASKELTINGSGNDASLSVNGTVENNGKITVNQVTSTTADAIQLGGNGQFTNNAGATLTGATIGFYGIRVVGSAVLLNQVGGTLSFAGFSGSMFLSGSTSPEMVQNHGKMTLGGQMEKYAGLFHNYPCGVVKLLAGEVYNNGGQILNEGFFSAASNLNGNSTESDFINNGIVYVGGTTSYTNNAIRIFNNATSTSIFEFAAANNLTVEGIYKDEAATASAGGFNQGTNTFTHFGLSAGSQTLYANITRSGGTCPQIVPFTFVVATASTFTTQPASQIVCAGSSASFTVAIANATGYQWQLNTGGSWNNVPATSPYTNGTTATLNISNATGLNGYQYRCVATGSGGATVTSNAATLTIGAGGGSNPTGTLTWTGGVDTDWNTACNWSPNSVPTATNDVVIPNTTNKPTISTAAVAQSVEVQTDAVLTIAATNSLTINGSKFIAGSRSGLFNAGTVHNNGQLILGNTGSVGQNALWNRGTFNNNISAEIKISNATSASMLNETGNFTNASTITINGGFVGLWNRNHAVFNNTSGEIKIDNTSENGISNITESTFNNAAKITIGAVISVGKNGINNFASFSNTTGGEITINAINASIYNDNVALFTNAAKITIGTTATAANTGIWNRGLFNNNTGGEIKIDNTTEVGLRNLEGTFTNVAKITIGATASVGGTGIFNYAVFNNNTGGEIRIDNATGQGVENESGTFTNAAKITIGFTSSTGQYGIHNRDNGTFNNNSGSEITIDRSTVAGLMNIRTSTFINTAKITIGATASVGGYGLANAFTGSFTNNPGGIITLDNSSTSGITTSAGSTLTNAATIIVGATASTGTYGLGNDGAVNNTACGKLIVASGILQNNASRTITNAGLVQVAGTLDNNGTFTNDGVLKYGSLTGTVTNATNASLIVNNTPTPIFTYGGTYDGVINGIYTDAAATLPAGTFTAPNTFTPSGLLAGSQTLYAKITPQGGGCVYVVPFTFVIAQGDYTWTGAVSKDWNTPGNWLVGGSVPAVAPTFGSQTGNRTLIPVVANGNYPEVTAASGARSVTIAANASLTIKSTGNLQIVGSDTDGVTSAGTFTNNGTVLIDSSYNDGFVNQTGASLINTNALTVRMGTGNRLENYGSVNNSGTFTVGGGLATAILNHPAATLTNTSTFAVSGGLTGGIHNQGTIDNSGQFTVSGGVSGTLFINQETVTNRSGATMTIGKHDSWIFDNQKLVENEGNLNISEGKGTGAINRQGATIRNKAGGTLYMTGTLKTAFRNGGLLENYHLVDFNGTPDTCFYNLPTGEIKNEATFRVSGTNRGIINLGKFTHGSAAILDTYSIGGIGFKNGGTFLSATGCVINSVSMNDLLLNLPNALFENKCATTFGSSRNAIVNQGRYTHTAGSFTGGSLNIILENSDYAEINVPFTSTGSMGKFFVNSDTLILGPQTTVTTSPNPFSTHSIPLTNTSTGYVHSQADFTIRSATTLIDNAGKMVLGSQSTLIGTDMGTPIVNTGNLTNEGTANFNRFGGYGIDNSGTFTNKGRFETGNSDKSIHNNGGTIENSGVMEIDSVFRDAVLQEGIGSSFTNTATGQINVDFVFGNGINNTAGTFTNNGTLLIAQTDTVALSGVNNAGMFQNNKLMRIGGVGKIKQHGLYNTGTFTNSTNSQVFLQSAEGSGITNQGGTITNQNCAYIESTPAILNAAGSFSNAGIIKKRKDNIVAVSTISANSGKIINEDTDAFNVTGSNSGATISITSSNASMSLCANTRTLTATPSGGTFSVTGPGSLAGNVLTATGVGTIVVSYAYNNDPSCPYFANQTIEVISTATPTGILTWTGAVSTDWNTACNWLPASVPTATNDVVIPNTTNKPTINTAAVAQSVEVQTGAVLTIAATKSLTINGSRTVAAFFAGFHNAGTVQNNGQLVLGSTGSVVQHGLINRATFNNNTGGEIKIDNVVDMGLYNTTGATFTNAAKIAIGATANIGTQGIVNDGTFNNNAGGEMTIDRSTQIALFNQNGTFNNAAKLTIGGVESAGDEGIKSFNVFNNNTGGEIKIEKVVKNALSSGGPFTNAGKIVIGASSVIESGILNGAVFDNNAGGEITIDRTTAAGLFNSGSSVPGVFNNAGKITIGALSSLGSTMGLGNINTFNNNACGQVIVVSGTISNDVSGSVTNLGLVQVVDTLENNGTFTNDGVLKYGSLTGTVTNATNASLIINNTPTPIFTYGGTYNGVVNGIYTDAAATLPAGTFTAPNTFVPSGLPAGVQTLYAKVTPQGGACSYIVPFTFNNTALAPVFTTQPTAISRCSGSSASFTAAATNATGYQWQLNSGGGWSNVPASAPYANGTTATLTISNVAGLNGYQFRCVAIGATVNTNSDPATLTVISKPTITLTTLQQTLNEGNSQTFCDTDANPVNGLQFTVSGLCVVGSPVWRSQVGSGAWSNWSATAPVSQPSNNQPHRYQAACDATCPSTYTSPIELTINYRASVPQNVSLLVDGVTIAVGETKEVCSLVTTTLTFNANCAMGEVILYSIDGGEYSSGVPVGLVDNQYHNYRVRCRKSDGTPSCVESESGVMRLKLVVIPVAPTVSLSPTSSCNPSASFSGQSTCGSLRTIWYNATTNVALPSLPSTVPSQTTSYYARCQTENGCVSEKSNVVTFTLTPTQVAPVITASQEIVCTGTTVRISANCPAGSQTFWNTGVTAPSFEVAFNNVTKQTYWAKCLFEGGCQSSESVRKDIYWNAFVVTLINIGESKSAIKSANDKSLWSSQFITRDGGPELEQSTQVNPTLFYVENVNKMAPRYWTINVEACGLSTDGSLTFDMLATPEMGVIRSFNTHENNAPYFMYANREGWTELYAQNHPAYGFYQDNGAGGNVYDAGLPKGLYKLGIRYWDQKGWGSIYPSTRKPQGNVLAYQEYWFRIQSKDGVGVGAARSADSEDAKSKGQGARGEGQGSDNGKQLTDNGAFATVLPNPVSNILRLKVQDSKGQTVQAALTDATGREVLRRQFVPETNTHQEEFGVSELPTGMYFLKVTTTDQQATLKVVKVN
ncbi:hypothetical protein FHS57_006185 [Runella defluvii]|uniref:Ig-like domain-containing protein n=1 Tax=Runella defluvii TaxID=370973 RepID=A0A7W5ZS72_9BACT|nr:T9SS type A sorting domain-containing protein [Runella defluvii]MBB3842154.1 hypothetical protein [Runella defluvii]